MNWKQKIVLLATISVIFLMGLFPPVTGKEYVQGHGLPVRIYPAKMYKSIFALGGSHIDRPKLCLQCLIVVLAGSGLILPLKDKKPKDEQKQ